MRRECTYRNQARGMTSRPYFKISPN